MSKLEFAQKCFENLLHKDENLKCFFWGNVDESNSRKNGYFALTETHFLAVFVSGTRVIDTVRMPLRIESVKIKISILFGKYSISVVFKNGACYNIFAREKVLGLKEQKENISGFIERIRTVSKKEELSMENADGYKVRWQYFNTYIYTVLSFVPVVPIMVLILDLKRGSFEHSKKLLEYSEIVPLLFFIIFIVLGPFLLLSLLNRFFFGKLVCVINDENLVLDDREIPLKNIEKVEYAPQIPFSYRSLRHIDFTYVRIFVRPMFGKVYSVDVLHFPIYGLKKLKQVAPHIKVRWNKSYLFLVLLPTVLSILVCIFS